METYAGLSGCVRRDQAGSPARKGAAFNSLMSLHSGGGETTGFGRFGGLGSNLVSLCELTWSRLGKKLTFSPQESTGSKCSLAHTKYGGAAVALAPAQVWESREVGFSPSPATCRGGDKLLEVRATVPPEAPSPHRVAAVGPALGFCFGYSWSALAPH